jgi:inner membrane protein
LDNVTHSLFGYALGRAFARSEPPDSRFSRGLISTAVIASNAPDLDFVSGFIGEDRQLIYLLEHRGFTHTLIFALGLGLATGFVSALALQLRAARERLLLGGFGSLACALHIAFDFLNDYGVHPFFPFDQRWYYGDSVFIIEPLLLALLLPLPLFFGLTRVGRVLSGLLALGLLVLIWVAGLPAARALAITGVLVASGWLQRRIGVRGGPERGPRGLAAQALIACVVVVALFSAGSQLAKAELRAALRAAAPTERVLDIASAPAPADPSCFRSLVVSLDPAGMYRLRVAKIGLLGGAAACHPLPAQPTAPLTAADVPNTRKVQFGAQFMAPAAQLAELAGAHCDAAALLRFVRVPFWQRRPDGMLLGDLRYDRGPGPEFAERILNGRCESGRLRWSPWTPPRADLLSQPP